MQTFLPYPDFTASAKCLDMRRLGKQRVEVLQILNALNGLSRGWTNHPATKMWRNHEYWLAQYGIAVCQEWKSRGYKDTTLAKICQHFIHSPQSPRPPWLGNPEFHASHRAVLLDKLPPWYSKYGWTETPAVKVNNKYPYVWP